MQVRPHYIAKKEAIMLYHSTRSSNTLVDSAQAVLSGLAPDGGLYVPQNLPKIDVAACLQESTMQMATINVVSKSTFIIFSYSLLF